MSATKCSIALAIISAIALAFLLSCSEDPPQIPQSTESPLSPAGGGSFNLTKSDKWSGPQFSSAILAVEAIPPESLTCDGVITFEDVTGGAPPGTNYDVIFESDGADIAERFAGQTRTTVTAGIYDFDDLSGTPSGPLALATGDPNDNVCVYVSTSCGVTNVLTGLGPVGFPSYDAIGEGSFAVLFDYDQSEFGFTLCGGDDGSATINFFKRDGTLIDQVVVNNLSNQDYAFRRVGGINDIAGISIHNTDPAGIAFDNLCHDIPGVPGDPVKLDIKPGSCPNALNPHYMDHTSGKKAKKKRISKAVLPVAILGSAAFDVTQIDVETVLLEGAVVRRSSIDDVASPVVDGLDCDCTTAGPDGFDDLTLKFYKRDIIATLGIVHPGDEIELTITGELLDGTPFEASDCILIVGRDLEIDPGQN